MDHIVQWYPGHMAKSRRLMAEKLGLVDVVAELLDARIPTSSRNPDIARLAGAKPRVVALNKVDLADAKASSSWRRLLSGVGVTAVVEIDAAKGSGLRPLMDAIYAAAQPQLLKEANRGRLPRPARVMVVGVPNVGKSSLINALVGKGSTRVADRPGVTRGQQWVRVRDNIELLDTPGILWPRFDDQAVGRRLALTGAVSLDVVDKDELARHLLAFLAAVSPDALMQRYKGCECLMAPGGVLLETPDAPVWDEGSFLRNAEAIGRARGYLGQGGEVDISKAVNTLLQDFRDGRLGRFTLDPLPAG